MHIKKRKTGFKPLIQPVLIVCEDTKLSVYYLKKKIQSKGLNPADVYITGDCGSAPKSVVNFAIKIRNERKKEAKRDGTLPYSKVYCVMDVDDHPSIRQSIIQARANNLIPIVSNECFELWYLLHFIKYSTGYKNRTQIKAELSGYLGKSYDKGDEVIFNTLQELNTEEKAILIAEKLEKAAEEESDEKDPLRNPTTEVYKLIKAINNKFSNIK